MSSRIAVTGIGLVTPLGIGHEQVWPALLEGKSGIRPVESFDTSAYPVHLGAEVPGFDPEPFLSTASRANGHGGVGRSSQLAIAAARLAVEDAGLVVEDRRLAGGRRTGVVMGTTSGEPIQVERYNDHRVAGELERVGAEFMDLYPCHVIASHVARELGLKGPCRMIPAACAAGSYAIAHAVDALRAGRAEVMLAGGADSFSRITYTGFARLGAIAKERCQPFDKNRQGMVPGEGAGVLVLEPLEKARERGARIWAEVAGYGLSCDAHHMTAGHPEGDGAARAMARALDDAGIDPAYVDYVSAHGTGTPTNDRIESRAHHRVLGPHAEGTPTSSIKSMIGHTMGAASAIESGVCSLAVAEGWMPPTVNFEEADPECPVDCIPNQARQARVRVAVNNAYAFGGNNASVVFREVA